MAKLKSGHTDRAGTPISPPLGDPAQQLARTIQSKERVLCIARGRGRRAARPIDISAPPLFCALTPLAASTHPWPATIKPFSSTMTGSVQPNHLIDPASTLTCPSECYRVETSKPAWLCDAAEAKSSHCA